MTSGPLRLRLRGPDGPRSPETFPGLRTTANQSTNVPQEVWNSHASCKIYLRAVETIN